MADRLRKILGLTKKKEPIDIDNHLEDPVECVIVEKIGSLSDLKDTLFKKPKLGCVETQRPERKKSRSETWLHGPPRAPLCGGESNVSVSGQDTPPPTSQSRTGETDNLLSAIMINLFQSVFSRSTTSGRPRAVNCWIRTNI